MNAASSDTTTTASTLRVGNINFHDTHIAVWEEEVDEPAMLLVLGNLLDHLRERGFSVGTDPVAERHTEGFIANYRPRMTRKAAERMRARTRAEHAYGRKGNLEFTAEQAGRTVKVEFFQNVANVENRSGGRYDFNRFRRMPRTMRLQCTVEIVAAIRHLQGLGYALGRDLAEPLARSVLRIAEGRVQEGMTPLERFRRTSGTDSLRSGALDEREWPIEAVGHYNRLDRDKVVLRPGDKRCLYSSGGRLIQGYVYPDPDMWWVCTEDGAWIDKVNASQLFTLGDDLPPRRRTLTKNEVLAKMDAAMRRASLAGDARRQVVIATAIRRLTDEPLYYVLSIAHSKRADGVLTWWGANARGYCYRLEHAGRYLASEIEANRGYYDNGDRNRAIPCEEVEKLTEQVRFVESRVLDPQPEADRVVRYTHLRALKAWRQGPKATRLQVAMTAENCAEVP